MQSIDSINTTVLDLLKAAKPDEAVRVLDEALGKWPRSARLLLTRGDVLLASEGAAVAVRHYAGLLADPAMAPWAAARVAALLDEREADTPTALAAVPAVAALADERRRILIFDRLLAGRSEDDEATVLRAITTVSPQFKYGWRRVIRLVEGGEMDAALAALEPLVGQREQVSAQAHLLLGELLSVQGRMDDVASALAAAIPAHGDNPDFCRRAIGLLQRAGALDLAAELMERSLERWPRDWMLLLRLNRQPIEPVRLQRIIADMARRAPPMEAQDDRFRFQYALVRLHAGDVAGALQLLEAPFEPPVCDLATPVLKALAACSIEGWRASSRFKDDRTKDVQVTTSPGARATVILTTGISFGNLPLDLVDQLFAAKELNVIYLRDFNKRAYLRGVPSLGAPEGATIDALKAMLAELGAPRIIAMGSSSGGFSALRYGVLLGADAAVSFSGPTDLTGVYHGARPVIWNANYFVQEIIRRDGELPLDLVPLLSEPGRTGVLQFYGEGAAADAAQARRIEGLPGVTVRAVAGVHDHFVVDHMIGDGAFEALLDDLAGD